MQITSNQGSSVFGRGRDRHSVEYNEVIAREGRITISFRQYPNNTVILYETVKNGRKHKITSKMENHVFDQVDVYEIFALLGIDTSYGDRVQIVERLKGGNFNHPFYTRF